MQYVPQRSDGMITTKTSLQKIALDKGEAAGKTEAFNRLAGDRNHFRPVKRGHAYLLRSLRHGDAPNAGAGGKIEQGNRRVSCVGEDVPAKDLRRRKAHGKNVIHQFLKEMAP